MTDYRTAAPRPFCVDCAELLLDLPSRLLNADGDLVCLRCFQQRNLADIETAEHERRRREAAATAVQFASMLPLALAAVMRTWAGAAIAVGIFAVGRVVAEVLSPRAFRTSGSS
jgi:hypothetical protein